MIDLLVVDATLHPHPDYMDLLESELLPGRNPVSMLIGQCSRLTDISRKALFCTESLPPKIVDTFRDAGFQVVSSGSSPDLQALLVKIKDYCGRSSLKDAALTYIDNPFLDAEVSNAVIRTHSENKAEYTFADNFPDGLAVEVLSPGFLAEICQKRSKPSETASRKVFDNLDADINQYYVEVWLPEEDISLRRLEFHADSPRNFALLRNFASVAGSIPDFKRIAQLIGQKPETLLVFPRYIEVEATTETDEKDPASAVTKLERPKGRLDMGTLVPLLKAIDAGTKDIIIAFAGIAEPMLNPDIMSLVEKAVRHPGVMSVILETNGMLFDDKSADFFSSLPPGKFQVIFRLDAFKQETAMALKGLDLGRSVAHVERFLSLRPENQLRTFVQFTKLKENLDEMEAFFRYWDQKGAQVIIQKYNSYAGQLPSRKVSDLTPLDRLPCWHLQRDWTVFWNGDVPVCKQDFQGRRIAGNVRTDSADRINENIRPVFIDNSKANFKGYPLCADCDEWYTYNF